MKRLLPCLFFLFIIASCNNNSQQEDGGPCTYNTNHYMAKIISVDSLDAMEYDIKFIAPGYKQNQDTFSYHSLYTNYLSPKLVKEKNLHVGQKIPFRVDEITKGTCSPRVTQLMLD